ncbi:MAG: hypothetical protein M3Z01_02680 [Thermoproteota archaeon]|nr:hypothetical protein [Thermoproteota archaeon]
MSESSRVDNNEFNLLKALGMDSQFLHDAVDKYRKDAQNDNKNNLVEIWDKIKIDRQKHVSMLKEALKEYYKQT